MQFKVRFRLLIPGLVVGLLSIGIIIKTIAYANENKFCDKWQIIGLGSVYVTSDTLNITENEITWPGCKPTSYKVISMEDNSAKFLVPHLESNSIQEDSGEGYLMVITSRGDDYIDIGVYDATTGENTEQELTWGSFRRIPFDKERNYFGSIGEFPITMHLVVAKSGQVDGF